MLQRCQQHYLTAEIRINVLVIGRKDDRPGALLMCFLKQIEHTLRLPAQRKAAHQTPSVQKNCLHPHPVRILQRINIHTDPHKPVLHLACRKPGTSDAAGYHSLRLKKILHHPCDLCFIHQAVCFAEQILIGIQHQPGTVCRHLAFSHESLFILIDKFPVSVESALLRKSRK